MIGDRRRVEQIFLNLINNALKFTGQGAVTVIAELPTTPSGPPNAAVAKPRVRVTVRDTGIGIRGEDLNALFKPFRQIDDGATRHHEGTGLGLAISRRLVTLLGGQIEAQSTWGLGSAFAVVLPLEPER